MKQSDKMKAMMMYEESPERKAAFLAEEIEKHDNDPDYLPSVPLDASLNDILAKLQEARRVHGLTIIAEQEMDEKQAELGKLFNRAVCNAHCGGDQKGMFVVTGEPGKAVVHQVRPEKRVERIKKQLIEKLPDGIPAELAEQLVDQFMEKSGADEAPKEKTPMRFH